MIKYYIKNRIQPLILISIFAGFLFFFCYSFLEYAEVNFIDFIYNGIYDIFDIKLEYLLNMNYYSMFYILYTYFMIIYLSRISLDIFNNDINDPIYASPYSKKEISKMKILTNYGLIITIYFLTLLLNIVFSFIANQSLVQIVTLTIIYCLITIFSFSLINILNVISLTTRVITSTLFYLVFLSLIILIMPTILNNSGLMLIISIIVTVIIVTVFAVFSVKYTGNRYTKKDLQHKSY